MRGAGCVGLVALSTRVAGLLEPCGEFGTEAAWLRKQKCARETRTVVSQYHATGGLEHTGVVNISGEYSLPPEDGVPGWHDRRGARAARLYGAPVRIGADAERQPDALLRRSTSLPSPTCGWPSSNICRSSLGAGSAEMRWLGSTLNAIEPNDVTPSGGSPAFFRASLNHPDGLSTAGARTRALCA